MSVEDRYVWYEAHVWRVGGAHGDGTGPKVHLVDITDPSRGVVVDESKIKPVNDETHKATEWWLEKLRAEGHSV